MEQIWKDNRVDSKEKRKVLGKKASTEFNGKTKEMQNSRIQLGW